MRMILKYLQKKKKWKTREPDIKNNNIKSGYRNKIWDGKMCHADNEKWEKRNNGRYLTAKSGNHTNA